MLIRLTDAQSIGALAYPAGAVVEVAADLGASLVSRGLAVPERPRVETATAPAAERAVTRKEKGG